jgi:hypothetical protein
MATRWTANARDTAIEAVAALTNGGAIQFRTGTPPANPEDTATGSLLVTVTLQNPSFSSSSDGELTALGLPLASTGVDDGTIGHARIIDSGGTAIYDEDDIGTGGNKITVNTLTVSQGVTFEITSWIMRARNPST